MYKEAKILLDSLTSRFRRQHEQLRAVIVRVLQPPAVSQATPSSPGGPPKNVEDEEAKPEALLDPADANAIQEVNLAYENVKEVDGLDVSKEGSEAWEAAIKRLVNFVFMMNNIDIQLVQYTLSSFWKCIGLKQFLCYEVGRK